MFSHSSKLVGFAEVDPGKYNVPTTATSKRSGSRLLT